VQLETRRRAGRPWSDRPAWARPEVERERLDDLLRVLGVHAPAPASEAMLTVRLMPGRWEPPVMLARRGLVLYLLTGALLRGHASGRVDLLLGGDAVQMEDADDGDRWRVLAGAEPTRVAVVAPSTVTALATVPGATQALMQSLLHQVELQLELRAIVGIQRIEQRIASFFALLARRVGVPVEDGTRIPLALEQKRIEEILSAGHTQATMAFRALFAAGVLVHDADGWCFRSSAPNSGTARVGSGPN
jgi:hypothetical protein